MADQKFFVYILKSVPNPTKHYVGLTADVSGRLNAHNAGQSIHTSRHRPWQLVASIQFSDEQIARRFEHYLKSGSGRAFAKKHFGDIPVSNL